VRDSNNQVSRLAGASNPTGALMGGRRLGDKLTTSGATTNQLKKNGAY